MPNQANFRSDVTTQTEPRFTASRIVRTYDEGVLLEELPASFGFDQFDNIEVHFYTVTGNNLVLSTNVRLSDTDVLKSHVVSYDDGQFKNYIRIDFTKLFNSKNQILIPGDYRMVLNFFSDEIGNYEERPLYIQQISPSRTEVQLGFVRNSGVDAVQQNKKTLKEFIEKSFDKPTALGVNEKIFKSGVELDNSTEGVTYDGIVANIEVPQSDQTYETTIGRVQQLYPQAEQSLEDTVNRFVLKLFETLREDIIIEGDQRIQGDEYKELIRKAVFEKLPELQTQVRQNVDSTIIIT